MIDTQKLAEYLRDNIEMVHITGYHDWEGVEVSEIKEALDTYFKENPLPPTQEELDTERRMLLDELYKAAPNNSNEIEVWFHGYAPGTDVDHIRYCIEEVHEAGRRWGGVCD